MNTLKYRPDIDGLRAIAVLSVLLYHLGVGVPGGYVGVDIFFVISGYLITSIIIKSISNNTFSFLDFMERRIRRIYPPMLLVVAATLLCAYQLQLPADFKQTAYSAIAQIFSLANVFFYMETGGYFRAQAEIMPLLHTWSLSVEEQFYLVVPLILLGLFRLARNWVGAIFTVGLISSLSLSIIGLEYFKTATFYLLPTRAWELGLGALLPVLALNRSSSPLRVANEAVSILGLMAIACALIMYDSNTPFPGQFALLPCLGTVAVIWANQSRNTFAYQVLSTKPFVGLGLISYSVYLWHWPLIAFSSYTFIDLSDYEIKGIIAALTIVLGYLSWKFVERPFREIKQVKRARIFSYWAISSLVVILSCGYIVIQNGFSNRFPTEVLSLAGENVVREPKARITLQQTERGQYIPIGTNSTEKPTEIFFWGDSHAQTILGSFDEYLRNSGIKGEAAVYPGVLPILDAEAIYPGSLGKQAPDWNFNILNYIQKQNIKAVVLAAAWNRNLRDNPERVLILSGLQKVVDALNANNIELYILAQVPESKHAYPRELALRLWKNGNVDNVGPSRAEYTASLQYDLFKKISGDFVILDPTTVFYPGDRESQLASIDNQPLYHDRDHLNKMGSDLLMPVYEQIKLQPL